jgi:hypothetical protein
MTFAMYEEAAPFRDWALSAHNRETEVQLLFEWLAANGMSVAILEQHYSHLIAL